MPCLDLLPPLRAEWEQRGTPLYYAAASMVALLSAFAFSTWMRVGIQTIANALPSSSQRRCMARSESKMASIVARWSPARSRWKM